MSVKPSGDSKTAIFPYLLDFRAIREASWTVMLSPAILVKAPIDSAPSGFRARPDRRVRGSVPYITNELDLSEEQVHAALAYIAANRSDVEAEYNQLLQRVQQANPPHVQAGRAKSFDVLKERIRARRLKDLNHADLDG